MMLTFAFVIAGVIASTRANDWDSPCTSGSCEYNWVEGGNASAVSSMVLVGGHQVLSDITPAAGWQIIGCNPDWASGSHDIRMVCTGTPEQIAHCNHLYDHGGAEETVVRLPENCGKGPFARVHKTYVPADQSHPYRLARRDGNATVVGLTLNYDFAGIPASRGNLTLAIAYTNVGGTQLTRRDMDNLHKRGHERLLAQRGFSHFMKHLVHKVVGEITSVWGKATSAIGAIASALPDATSFDKSGSTDVFPINIASKFTLLDTTIACGHGSNGSDKASLHIDVETDVAAQVSFAYTIVGSIVPPKLEDVAAFGLFSGDASATFNIKAEAQGTFDTGVLQLFKTGFPGLSIPGIVALGPEFSIGTELVAKLEVEAEMSLTTDFSFPNLQLLFPPSMGESTGTGQPNQGSNALKFSAGPPKEAIEASVAAHVIPRVDLGIDFMNGLAKASVFMDLDMSGVVALKLSASPSTTSDSTTPDTTTHDYTYNRASGGIIGRNAAIPSGIDSGATPDTTSAQSHQLNRRSNAAIPKGPVLRDGQTSFNAINRSSPLNSSSSSNGYSIPASAEAIASSQPARATPMPVKRSIIQRADTVEEKRAAQSITGCVEVTANVVVNAGLDAALEPLFSQPLSFPVFKASAQLLEKCFGGDKKRRALTSRFIGGGSTPARAYRHSRIARAASGNTKNDVTPQQSTGDKSALSCSASFSPLSALLSIL
ncbi:hypothetical protein JB92DRAFT_2798848 [Gautieria morchelliformis]|nr:hypothetical protein JB92DRAFT_2798848 [Gautieria morchelliformis]